MTEDQFLAMARNLARYHREHEKFYARAPLLRTAAEENDQAGDWLAAAMETSWGAAGSLLQFPQLADLISERHRIISNDWQAASLMKLLARNLERAGAVLEILDFSPAGIRTDLDGARVFPDFLHSACDLIDHASDLAAAGAALVHANERRWRVFRQRIDELVELDE